MNNEVRGIMGASRVGPNYASTLLGFFRGNSKLKKRMKYHIIIIIIIIIIIMQIKSI
jgi:hypothetical protein